MTEKLIQTYIREERARCADLAERFGANRFLVYCIRNSIAVDEIEAHRQRFGEMPDEIEDLM